MNKSTFFDTPRSFGGSLGYAVRRLGRSLERRLRLLYTPGFSEQTIEYPLLFHALPEPPRTVLDFGCVENVLPIILCNLGYEVAGLDFLPYPFSHPRFRFSQHDILTWEPPRDAFDVVVSISTIEHVGLGYSGDPADAAGDKHAVEKLWTALKPGGLLYITLPAGRPTIRRGYRTYDAASVRALVPSIERLRFFAKASRNGTWDPVEDHASVASIEYDQYESLYPTQAVAVVEARKAV